MEINEALPEYQRYTYEDYCSWDDDKRWELIDGFPYAMSAPNRKHQEISGNIFSLLHNFLKGNPCKVYAAPFDVRLNADTYDDTVVQPDLLVVCDKSKLNNKGCTGAPDMVIEILSPSTAMLDRFLKFNQYLRAGIKEYWIVDPDSRTVSVYILKNGEYVAHAYGNGEPIPVHVLKGCTIDMQEVFEE